MPLSQVLFVKSDRGNKPKAPSVPMRTSRPWLPCTPPHLASSRNPSSKPSWTTFRKSPGQTRRFSLRTISRTRVLYQTSSKNLMAHLRCSTFGRPKRARKNLEFASSLSQAPSPSTTFQSSRLRGCSLAQSCWVGPQLQSTRTLCKTEKPKRATSFPSASSSLW